MENCLVSIGLICFVLLSGVNSTNAGDDLVESPVVYNQNVPMLAMFDITKVNKHIKAHFSEAFEKRMSNFVKIKLEDVLMSLKIDEDLKQYIEHMNGNLTLNIEMEIKDYFDHVKQNLTDALLKGNCIFYVFNVPCLHGHQSIIFYLRSRCFFFSLRLFFLLCSNRNVFS